MRARVFARLRLLLCSVCCCGVVGPLAASFGHPERSSRLAFFFVACRVFLMLFFYVGVVSRDVPGLKCGGWLWSNLVL